MEMCYSLEKVEKKFGNTLSKSSHNRYFIGIAGPFQGAQMGHKWVTIAGFWDLKTGKTAGEKRFLRGKQLV